MVTAIPDFQPEPDSTIRGLESAMGEEKSGRPLKLQASYYSFN